MAASSAAEKVSEDDVVLGLSPDVLRVLIDNHARFLSFLERRVGRREIAEEILQEAFVKGVSRAAPLRDNESAVGWFYRVLRNALIDHFRRSSAEARALAALANESEREAGRDVDQDLVDLVCACVASLVETLKPEYAQAIQKVDLGTQGLEEFARGAGITRGNAAVRLFRARQALRLRVEQSCGTCATHGCYQCVCQARC